MPSRDTETRYVTFVDIPLLRRLHDRSVLLDNELIFTRDRSDTNSSLLSSVLLPQRMLYTLVARSETQQVVGQFRLRADEPNAHVVYLAPNLMPSEDDSAWLHVLDSMAQEAGRHGAHALLAEVDERSPLFETMRTAGYAVYARQEVWIRPPGEQRLYSAPLPWTEENAEDIGAVNRLIQETVPGLVQQYAVPPVDMPRLVYREDGRVKGYLAYAEGRHGIYLIPYFHPDLLSDTPLLMESAIRQIPRHDRLPVAVSVRRYQDWIIEALPELGFEPVAQQAVMVKHIAAGVRHAQFGSLAPVLRKVPHAAKPPSHSIPTPVPCIVWEEKEPHQRADA